MSKIDVFVHDWSDANHRRFYHRRFIDAPKIRVIIKNKHVLVN